MRIYTKTGDTGLTSAIGGGAKLPKSDSLFAALGALDELNSSVGVAVSQADLVGPRSSELVDLLQYLQCRILDAGTSLAAPVERSGDKAEQRSGDVDKQIPDTVTPVTSPIPISDPLLKFTCADEAVQILESRIDSYDQNLPVLRNFVLPGGNAPLSDSLVGAPEMGEYSQMTWRAFGDLLNGMDCRELSRMSERSEYHAVAVSLAMGLQGVQYCFSGCHRCNRSPRSMKYTGLAD
eukprot:jgi/Mesvir1/28675/Mv02946-RA.1